MQQQSTTIMQHLLSQVSALTTKYDEIAKVTGENFNIFSVLKLESDEVRLHSRLLGELLNPEGSHGMYDTFLKLLIQSNDKLSNYVCDTDTKNTTIEIERGVGIINGETMIGGRIDIIIKFRDGKMIVIENKIDAPDQDGQLRRYYNSFPNSQLVYLTKFGDKAEDKTTQNNLFPEKIIEPLCLSYKENIIHWLELCRKEAVNQPLVREIITQYINIIKHVTNQTINEKMKNEIIEIITSNESQMKSAFEIASNIEDAKKKLFLEFAISLKNELSEFETIRFPDNFGEAHNGIEIKTPVMPLENAVKFSFFRNYKECFVEIVNTGNGQKPNIYNDNVHYYREALQSKLSKEIEVKQVEGKYWGDWIGFYNRIGNDDFYILMANKSKRESFILEIANDLRTIVKVIEKNKKNK